MPRSGASGIDRPNICDRLAIVVIKIGWLAGGVGFEGSEFSTILDSDVYSL